MKLDDYDLQVIYDDHMYVWKWAFSWLYIANIYFQYSDRTIHPENRKNHVHLFRREINNIG